MGIVIEIGLALTIFIFGLLLLSLVKSVYKSRRKAGKIKLNDLFKRGLFLNNLMTVLVKRYYIHILALIVLLIISFYTHIGDNYDSPIEQLIGACCKKFSNDSSHCFQITGYTKKEAIKVRANDIINVKVTKDASKIYPGFFLGSFLGYFDANGKSRGILNTPLDDYNLIRGFPHCALLCKVSTDKGWKLCGEYKQFVAENPGFLEFEINDRIKSDNKGSFCITVSILRVNNDIN